MQRSGLGLMVRPETARVSRCPNSSPVRSGSRGFSLKRGRGGLGKGGHEHNENSLHLLHRHAAAEAAEATAPEATEAATAAPRRVTRYAVMRAAVPFQARPSSPIYSRMLVRPRTLPSGFIAPCLPTKTDELPSGGACRPVEGRTANDHHGVEIAGRRPARPRQRVPDANRVN